MGLYMKELCLFIKSIYLHSFFNSHKKCHTSLYEYKKTFKMLNWENRTELVIYTDNACLKMLFAVFKTLRVSIMS